MINLRSNKQILDTVPHGSGINSTWNIERRNNKVYLTNYFDTMNESGFYDVVIPFTLVIPLVEPEGFSLRFPRGYHYYVGKYMLRDYLEDTFSFWLS